MVKHGPTKTFSGPEKHLLVQKKIWSKNTFLDSHEYMGIIFREKWLGALCFFSYRCPPGIHPAFPVIPVIPANRGRQLHPGTSLPHAPEARMTVVCTNKLPQMKTQDAGHRAISSGISMVNHGYPWLTLNIHGWPNEYPWLTWKIIIKAKNVMTGYRIIRLQWFQRQTCQTFAAVLFQRSSKIEFLYK